MQNESPEASLIAKAETHEIAGLRLRTISLDDLIRVKEHIGRSKDRDSLYQLLAIKRLREEEGLGIQGPS